MKQNGLPVRCSGKREFVWTKELTEKAYDGFRIQGETDSKARTAEQICPEEIANAAAPRTSEAGTGVAGADVDMWEAF